jgi:hypothetical protein
MAFLVLVVLLLSRAFHLALPDHSYAVLLAALQLVAMGALVKAYRRIGGMGYLVWFSFILLEVLLFVPRQMICYLTSGWVVPICFSLGWFYDARYVLYITLFLLGLYMTRQGFADYLKSREGPRAG